MRNHLLFLALGVLFVSCRTSSEPQAPRPSSAAGNVIILEDSLAMPGLDRNRLLRLYLPPDYATGTERYPVIYMHDGQNLFDDSTSFAGEWGVDEILNAIAEEGGRRFIVVGIDNGGERRMSELGPYANARFAPSEGAAYVDFLVDVVKPYIDANYRTRPERDDTAIIGSSMGGLISHYAILEHPRVFAKAGIFSPSYWFSEEAFAQAKNNRLPADSRLFLLVGEKEGGDMTEGTLEMEKTFLGVGHPRESLKVIVDPEGEHNEAFWRAHFQEALTWLFQE